MNRSIFETLLGMIVIVGAIAFILYGYSFSQNSTMKETKTIQAYFNQSGGLIAGADVRMAGVTIGKVQSVTLDNERFLAHVIMTIQDKITLPESTSVEIASDGFVGGKYVRLSLTDYNSPINKSGVFKNTKDVETLEQLLGKVIFLTKE